MLLVGHDVYFSSWLTTTSVSCLMSQQACDEASVEAELPVSKQ